MIPEFHGRIRGGVFRLNRPKVFDAYAQGQKDGDYYTTLHKTKGPPKTPEQMGYYYVAVLPTIFKSMVGHGNDTIIVNVGGGTKELPLTEEIVDDMLKMIWAKKTGVEVKSKSKFTIEEASELISISIRWAARYLGCVVPESDLESV